jgi:salicylate hydroxylase
MPQFRILIVGAGIAGFSTAIGLRGKGHDVTVLERHAECQALGGPVILSANATRVLLAYGLEDDIKAKCPPVRNLMSQRRYENGAVLASLLKDKMKDVYGFPSWMLSRYRLQEIMSQVAEERGVKIIFNCLIAGVNLERPAIRLANGKEMEADIVIGADGIGSVIRDTIVGQTIKCTSPFSAYKIDIPRSFLRADSQLEHLLDESDIWLGPGRICVCLNMPDNGDKLNVCLVSDEPQEKEGEWYQLGNLEKVKAKFADFEPTIHKLLVIADPQDCYIWRLSELPPLKQ